MKTVIVTKRDRCAQYGGFLQTMRNTTTRKLAHIVALLLMHVLGSSSQASDSVPSGNPYWVWNNPLFVFGRTPPLIFGDFGRSTDPDKNTAEINYLSSIAYIWALSSSLQPQFTIGCVPGDTFNPEGCLDNSIPDLNRRNTIMFNKRPPDGFPEAAIGFTRLQTVSAGGLWLRGQEVVFDQPKRSLRRTSI